MAACLTEWSRKLWVQILESAAFRTHHHHPQPQPHILLGSLPPLRLALRQVDSTMEVDVLIFV